MTPTSVRLRRWQDSDAAWYVACSRDPEVQRFTTDPSDLTVERVVAAIDGSRRDPDREAFLVARADDGARLGNIAALYRGRTVELSYWTAPAHRGQGVASAALIAICAWLSPDGRADLAELWTHADNRPSQLVAERAGFAHVPAEDRVRQVKGKMWPTVTYRRALEVSRTAGRTG
jgi:RimJ/RimL family protein N-acetyltransferase